MLPLGYSAEMICTDLNWQQASSPAPTGRVYLEGKRVGMKAMTPENPSVHPWPTTPPNPPSTLAGNSVAMSVGQDQGQPSVNLGDAGGRGVS